MYCNLILVYVVVLLKLKIHEHHTYAIKDWNRELCIQDPQPVNGFFEVSEEPGIGIELNDEVVYRSPHMEVK